MLPMAKSHSSTAQSDDVEYRPVAARVDEVETAVDSSISDVTAIQAALV